MFKPIIIQNGDEILVRHNQSKIVKMVKMSYLRHVRTKSKSKSLATNCLLSGVLPVFRDHLSELPLPLPLPLQDDVLQRTLSHVLLILPSPH